MSKAENNPALNKQRGMFGGTMVFRQVNGETIISARPKKRDKPTEHQLKTKGRFLKAVEYARSQMAIPENKALYQKAINRKIPNAYTAALKDFLNAPVVAQIDTTEYTGQVGSILHFRISDDFEVVSVRVEIFDSLGFSLESGQAKAWDLQGDGWEYNATMINTKVAGSRIVVTAKDRPGNTTAREHQM
ncbi:MAG: hypothetical protein QM762_15765 [Chryseolinea sp.]